jgi:hypothetical protein
MHLLKAASPVRLRVCHHAVPKQSLMRNPQGFCSGVYLRGPHCCMHPDNSVCHLPLSTVKATWPRVLCAALLTYPAGNRKSAKSSSPITGIKLAG